MLKNKHKFNAFTLAEMMVVMLIMSIVLAAMAPVMTTKNKVDNSSPWKYSPNNSSDAYFGQGASMRAMIGQLNGEDTDNGKLIINNLGSSFSHILFKNGNTILGDLYMSGNNLILGHRNGSSTSLGQNNINIGPNNWPSTDITGQSNIIIGDNAMTHLSTGSNNIGLGTTLTALTTGTGNVTIGDNSLISVTTGSGNIGLGNEANPAITTASKTIAIGTNSVAGSLGAIAIGSNIESGEGTETNGATARGGHSIAIGNGAISNYDNSINGLSIAIGTDAKANSEDDNGNAAIAIGYGAESNGSAAIAIGSGANAPSGCAIAIGDDARATGGRSIAIGPSNGRWDGDNDGSTMAAGENSIALGIGAYALSNNSIAIGNDAKAPASAYSTSPAAGNIAIGPGAMKYGKSSFGSVAIGIDALQNVDEGTNNIGIGQKTLYNTTSGWHNIALGYEALKNNTTGTYNIALGYGAGNASTSPSYNTAVGAYTLYNNQTGGQNTALGYNACQYVTGSNKTCIGANSGPSSSDTLAKNNEKVVYLGDADTTVYIPGNLIVRGNVALATNRRSSVAARLRTIGDYWYAYLEMTEGGGAQTVKQSGVGRTKNDVSFQDAFSDRRLKYVGKENTSGLDKIKQLKVFNYVYKKDTTKTPHVGVIAQDLQKVFPNAVKKGTDGFLTIRMEDMFYAVINAIKELDAKMTALQKENQELKQLVKQVQEDNKRLDQRLQKLEAKQK